MLLVPTFFWPLQIGYNVYVKCVWIIFPWIMNVKCKTLVILAVRAGDLAIKNNSHEISRYFANHYERHLKTTMTVYPLHKVGRANALTTS
jgi:hypothetical protein